MSQLSETLFEAAIVCDVAGCTVRIQRIGPSKDVAAVLVFHAAVANGWKVAKDRIYAMHDDPNGLAACSLSRDMCPDHARTLDDYARTFVRGG